MAVPILKESLCSLDVHREDLCRVLCRADLAGLCLEITTPEIPQRCPDAIECRSMRLFAHDRRERRAHVVTVEEDAAAVRASGRELLPTCRDQDRSIGVLLVLVVDEPLLDFVLAAVREEIQRAGRRFDVAWQLGLASRFVVRTVVVRIGFVPLTKVGLYLAGFRARGSRDLFGLRSCLGGLGRVLCEFPPLLVVLVGSSFEVVDTGFEAVDRLLVPFDRVLLGLFT